MSLSPATKQWLRATGLVASVYAVLYLFAFAALTPLTLLYAVVSIAALMYFGITLFIESTTR